MSERRLLDQLANHPDVATLLELLTSDVSTTMGWPSETSRDFVVEEAAVNAWALDEGQVDRFVFIAIENVQERFHGEFIDVVWPECPWHGGHPLWPTESPPWAWRCDGNAIALGSLRNRRA